MHDTGTHKTQQSKRHSSEYTKKKGRFSIQRAHTTTLPKAQTPPIQSVACPFPPIKSKPNAITMHFCPQVATPNIPNSTKKSKTSPMFPVPDATAAMQVGFFPSSSPSSSPLPLSLFFLPLPNSVRSVKMSIRHDRNAKRSVLSIV